MTNIEADRVTNIYLGRDRICRCGCAGEYVRRGESMFEKRLNRFMKMAKTYKFCDTPEQPDIGANYLNISYGKDRALTVYFD